MEKVFVTFRSLLEAFRIVCWNILRSQRRIVGLTLSTTLRTVHLHGLAATWTVIYTVVASISRPLVSSKTRQISICWWYRIALNSRRPLTHLRTVFKLLMAFLISFGICWIAASVAGERLDLASSALFGAEVGLGVYSSEGSQVLRRFGKFVRAASSAAASSSPCTVADLARLNGVMATEHMDSASEPASCKM